MCRKGRRTCAYRMERCGSSGWPRSSATSPDRSGTQRNQLPDLMRRWFGPAAGNPGTDFRVRFYRSPDGWWVEPKGRQGGAARSPRPAGDLPHPPRGRRRCLGIDGGSTGSERDPPPARTTGEDVFAIRADGDSMDGGPSPIRDGDWLVMRYARGTGIGAMQGSVALLQLTDDQGGTRYQVKRVVKEGETWRLRSDNPERESFDAGANCIPIAKHQETIRPEALAPPEGTELAEADIGAAFHLSEAPRTGRTDGHLFFLATDGKPFPAPDRLDWTNERRPGETLYLHLKIGRARWRYCGVGRWIEEERLWRIPPFDHDTWKRISGGRSSSRSLPPEALRRASELVKRLLTKVSARHHAGGAQSPASGCSAWLRRVASGSMVVGEASPSARFHSLTSDGSWPRQTMPHAPRAALDEALVNRLRYLEGTKGRIDQMARHWMGTQAPRSRSQSWPFHSVIWVGRTSSTGRGRGHTEPAGQCHGEDTIDIQGLDPPLRRRLGPTRSWTSSPST